MISPNANVSAFPGRSKGAVIWLTGLSGAGKTTLSAHLKQSLSNADITAITLDGDELRTGLCSDLGFSVTHRKENIRRTGEVAMLLANEGFVVIVSLISPFRRDRKHVAQQCKKQKISFAEVFVNASLEECERRDPKDLYRRARAGEIPKFTGINSRYEAPLSPDLELRTELETPKESVAKLAALTLALLSGNERNSHLSRATIDSSRVA